MTPLPNRHRAEIHGEVLSYLDIPGNTDEESCNTLVAIHGNLSNAYGLKDIWELPCFSSWRVVAPELRGFGQSSHNQSPGNHKGNAKDVAALLQRLGLQKFVLFGWSTGGPVVMELAAMLPERVQGVVLYASVSTRGLGYGRKADGTIMTREECDTVLSASAVSLIQSKSHEACYNLWNAIVYSGNLPLPSIHSDEAQQVIQGILEERPEACQESMYYNIEWRGDEALHKINKAAAAGSKKFPFLILHGSLDKCIPVSEASDSFDDIQAAMGDDHAVELEIVEGGSHFPIRDGRDQVGKVLASFLQKRVS